MPIFEYKCQHCQQSVDLIVGYADHDSVWHKCLDNKVGECSLAKRIGATRTTFVHADKTSLKIARK